MGGSIIMEPKAIAMHYLRTWFFPDVVSTFPFDQVLGNDDSVGRINRILRMTRVIKLLRVLRLSRAFHEMEASLTTMNPAVLRLVQLIFILVVLWHWVGCCWFAIRHWEDDEQPPNLLHTHGDEPSPAHVLMHSSREDDEPLVLAEQYSFVYYWAVATMSGSIPTQPRHLMEAWFCNVAIVLGVFLNAAVIGSASSAYSNLDSSSARYRERFDRLRAFLLQKKTPSSIAKQVLSYAEFSWSRSKTADERWLMQELPSALRLQVMISMQRRLFTQIDLFRRLNPEIVVGIISCMQPLICLPGEEVIQQDTAGVGLFFITEGSVHVMQNGIVHATLHEGDFFGERSLLRNTRSNASVVALGYVNLMVLYRREFNTLVHMHPEIALQMTKIQQEHDELVGHIRSTQEAEAKQRAEALNWKLTRRLVRVAKRFQHKDGGDATAPASGRVTPIMSAVDELDDDKVGTAVVEEAGEAHSRCPAHAEAMARGGAPVAEPPGRVAHPQPQPSVDGAAAP